MVYAHYLHIGQGFLLGERIKSHSTSMSRSSHPTWYVVENLLNGRERGSFSIANYGLANSKD